MSHTQDEMPSFNMEMEVDAPNRCRARLIQETCVLEGPASRFFRKGRLSVMPTKRKNRLLVLEALADCFEPHRTYTENEVNEVLLHFHDDYCSLRRALVDEGFLFRLPSGAKYWRINPPPAQRLHYKSVCARYAASSVDSPA
jgi:hypothetical protein